MVLIPNGLTINERTDWHPVYSDLLIIYYLFIFTITFIPTLYNSIQIYKSMEDEELKKRWKFFVIGAIELAIYAYTTLITYKITLGLILLPYSIVSFVLILTSSYFLYYGIARKIGEDKT